MNSKNPNLVTITGCAGFIGSHATDLYLHNGFGVYGVDKFTYAAKESNLAESQKNSKFICARGDICDQPLMETMLRHSPWVINFAAETHVDNSISSSDDFIETNIRGVQSILEACRKTGTKLLHISTDEVYGSISYGSHHEASNLNPKNPYSATKAAADHLIKSYANTYGIEYIIVRPSNNFGPRQHSEKFLPTIVRSLKEGKKIPMYGDGSNVRDWLYVKDNVAAIYHIMKHSDLNQTYNITRKKELPNLEICREVCDILGKDPDKHIEFVSDRPGHDFRYSITNDKLKSLGFESKSLFKDALSETVQNLWKEA